MLRTWSFEVQTIGILAILNEGIEMGSLGEAVVVLILKVKTPVRVSDFRPISLYNIIYKLVILDQLLGRLDYKMCLMNTSSVIGYAYFYIFHMYLRLFLTSFSKIIVSDPIKFLKNPCKITDEPIIYSYLKSDFPTLFSFCFLLTNKIGEIDGEEEEEEAEEEEGEGATDQKNSRTRGDRRREHPSERRTPAKKKKKKKKPKTPKKKKKNRTQEREGELDPFDRERVRVRSDDGEVRLRFVRLRSMFAVGLEAVHLAVCDYRSLSPVKPKLSSTFQVNFRRLSTWKIC
ncbi:hypothetical protein ACOSQ4_027319 [Xanthoceras sorbifolium]